MTSLDYWLLLMGDSVDSNKVDSDEKIKKLMKTLASIHDNLIGNIDHIFHQYRISSPDNDV